MNFILNGFVDEIEKQAFWGLLARGALGLARPLGKKLFGVAAKGAKAAFATPSKALSTGLTVPFVASDVGKVYKKTGQYSAGGGATMRAPSVTVPKYTNWPVMR